MAGIHRDGDSYKAVTVTSGSRTFDVDEQGGGGAYPAPPTVPRRLATDCDRAVSTFYSLKDRSSAGAVPLPLKGRHRGERGGHSAGRCELIGGSR